MLTLIKEIFTWWNQQTLGTRIETLIYGKYVGKDKNGNKYYQSKSGKRWVIYNGEINASKITSDWFSWIHHITNNLPSDRKQKKYSWQKPHKDNKTGTRESYKPNTIDKKAKDFKKYETWKP